MCVHGFSLRPRLLLIFVWVCALCLSDYQGVLICICVCQGTRNILKAYRSWQQHIWCVQWNRGSVDQRVQWERWHTQHHPLSRGLPGSAHRNHQLHGLPSTLGQLAVPSLFVSVSACIQERFGISVLSSDRMHCREWLFHKPVSTRCYFESWAEPNNFNVFLSLYPRKNNSARFQLTAVTCLIPGEASSREHRLVRLSLLNAGDETQLRPTVSLQLAQSPLPTARIARLATSASSRLLWIWTQTLSPTFDPASCLSASVLTAAHGIISVSAWKKLRLALISDWTIRSCGVSWVPLWFCEWM